MNGNFGVFYYLSPTFVCCMAIEQESESEREMDKDTYFNMIDVKLMSFFSVVLAESGIKKNVHGDRVAGIGTMCALVTSFVYLPSIS